MFDSGKKFETEVLIKLYDYNLVNFGINLSYFDETESHVRNELFESIPSVAIVTLDDLEPANRFNKDTAIKMAFVCASYFYIFKNGCYYSERDNLLKTILHTDYTTYFITESSSFRVILREIFHLLTKENINNKAFYKEIQTLVTPYLCYTFSNKKIMYKGNGSIIKM